MMEYQRPEGTSSLLKAIYERMIGVVRDLLLVLNVMFTVPRGRSGRDVSPERTWDFSPLLRRRDFDWCEREGKMDGDCLVLAVGTPGGRCSVVPYLSEASQIANGSSHLDSHVEKLQRG